MIFSFLYFLFFSVTTYAMYGGIDVKPNDPLISSFVGIKISNMNTGNFGYCTGTIIGKKTVLTAAHCFNHIKNEKNISITVSTTHRPYASTNSNPLIQSFSTTKVSIYPKYLTYIFSHEKLSSDVALIHIENSEFSIRQKPLPLIYPGAMESFPSAFQIYAVGSTSDKINSNDEVIFKKENFHFTFSEQVRTTDPEELYTGITGGFFLVNHPQSKLLPGNSGSSAITNRYGIPTVVGVSTGTYKLHGKIVGFSFVNLNEPEINKWIRSLIR